MGHLTLSARPRYTDGMEKLANRSTPDIDNNFHSAAPGMVIVGAGLAGLTVAETLRSDGYSGTITLLGDEPRGPYHRPPLSKGFLLGNVQEAQLPIRSPAQLEKKAISTRVGVGVTAIDRSTRTLTLSDGTHLPYAGLALCTGSRLRTLRLPGCDTEAIQGIRGLRTLDDARAIAAALDQAHHVVVIGGGFIGLEVAAAARKKDKAVTVLEAADRLMARSVAPKISAFYRTLHESHGVQVVLNARVTQLLTEGGRITAVRTEDGTNHAADLLLVGIGVQPNSDLAEAAGIACQGGILVDVCSRTSDPLIVAAGDCTVRRTGDGALLQLESVQNATEQGKAAAAALLGRERPFTAVPWFWSDQYDVKLQMVGLSAGHDRIEVHGDMDGDTVPPCFSVFYYRNDRLMAVDSINQPAEHMAARRRLEPA